MTVSKKDYAKWMREYPWLERFVNAQYQPYLPEDATDTDTDLTITYTKLDQFDLMKYCVAQPEKTAKVSFMLKKPIGYAENQYVIAIGYDGKVVHQMLFGHIPEGIHFFKDVFRDQHGANVRNRCAYVLLVTIRNKHTWKNGDLGACIGREMEIVIHDLKDVPKSSAGYGREWHEFCHKATVIDHAYLSNSLLREMMLIDGGIDRRWSEIQGYLRCVHDRFRRSSFDPIIKPYYEQNNWEGILQFGSVQVHHSSMAGRYGLTVKSADAEVQLLGEEGLPRSHIDHVLGYMSDIVEMFDEIEGMGSDFEVVSEVK